MGSLFFLSEASLLCKYVVNGLFSFKQDFVSSNPTLVYIIRARNRIFSYQPALILAKIALQVCGICQICILRGVHYLLLLHIHRHWQHCVLEEFGFSFLLFVSFAGRSEAEGVFGELGFGTEKSSFPSPWEI